MRGRFVPKTFLTVFAVFLSAASMNAASFSFEGNFSLDDDLQVFWLTVGVPSTVTIRTLSYGGGTNAAGNTIVSGGFDPILNVFQGLSDPNGLQIAANNDGTCPPNTIDPITNACWDSLLELALAPGQYTLVLSQSDNSAFGPFLGDGFSRTGQGNFTGPAFLGGPGSFIDLNSVQRTNRWAVDILDVASATAVPEPASMLLILSGIIVLVRAARRPSV